MDLQALKKEINNINIKKSSGLDHISSFVMKQAFAATPHVLLHIMNVSLALGIFPKAWKDATIVPLEKKTNAPSPSDFRPISLLPLPGKILERMVSDQMTNYLEGNGLLGDGQEGFRKARSTTKAVANLTDDVFQQSGIGNLTAAVFIDFRKAFDCVNHTILLAKLDNLGFGKGEVDWFRSHAEKTENHC